MVRLSELRKRWTLSRPQEVKASSVGSLVAYNHVGHPVWTPRNYQALTEQGYRQNVIVYRCVHLIARGAASVPWRLYKKNQELETHPLLTLLHRPSAYQAGNSFIESVLGYLLLAGNSYIEGVVSSRTGHPKELYPLRPDRMKVIPGSSGFPVGFEYSVHGKRNVIPCHPLTGRAKVLHLKLFNPLHDWYGMSPLEAAACSIDQHNAVSTHNLALLQNGGRPSGALIVNKGNRSQGNGVLTPEQREELRQDLRDLMEGERNAGRVMILEGDFAWQEMGLSPKNLDFIEGKNLSAREIAQAFNVPPLLVGIPGESTFANYKEARFHLWEDTILPLLDYLVDELNAWLCPQFDAGLTLSYDIDAIPALAARREAAWAKVSAATFLTLNEKRRAMGYEPLPGGDVLDFQRSQRSPSQGDHE